MTDITPTLGLDEKFAAPRLDEKLVARLVKLDSESGGLIKYLVDEVLRYRALSDGSSFAMSKQFYSLWGKQAQDVFTKIPQAPKLLSKLLDSDNYERHEERTQHVDAKKVWPDAGVDALYGALDEDLEELATAMI